MGGKEATRKLIRLDPKIKAIVSSGDVNNAVMNEFRKYGFSGVIPKPYNMEELSKALEKALIENLR